ncbi:MAG: hypothetical protein K0R66_1224 [Gammaproteobacteria bacterium]|jgi:hypothetical protein|nr:hypothetical protein [Gammaproteobacteria bacterium]
MSIFSLAMPSINDQSVYILNQIIGAVNHMVDSSQPDPGGYIIPGDPSSGILPLPVFALMLQYFNQALLGCGTILFAIMVFVGTINTAAEGQFLGKDWHSIWTPIRLIFGLLFVIPLQNGLCIGQKIVLYAILIGVNMGTTVWQQTINQIFENNVPPPVPSFLSSTVTEAVDGVFLNIAVQSIANQFNASNSGSNSPSSCPAAQADNLPSNATVLCVNNNYTIGKNTLPPSVLNALSTQYNGLCNLLFPGQAASCQKAVSSALSSSPFNGNVTSDSAYFSLAINSTTTDSTPLNPPVISNYSLNGNSAQSNWSSTILPNGNAHLSAPSGNATVNVSGYYAYTPTSPSNLPNCSNIASGDIGAYMYCDINNIVNTYVMNYGNNSSCPANAPSGQASCSFQGVTSDILAQAQNQIAIQAFDQASLTPPVAGSESYTNNTYVIPGSSPILDANGKPLVDNIVNGNHEGSEVYPVTINLNDYIVPGANSQSPAIDIPLNNSWWVAGRSYLIVDNQFSQSLQYLYGALNQVINQFNQLTNFKSSFLLTYQTYLWEQGFNAPQLNSAGSNFTMQYSCGPFNYTNMVGPNNPLFSLGYYWVTGAPSYRFASPSNPAQLMGVGSPPLYTCQVDDTRGTAVLQASYPFQASDIAPTQWALLIAPFNPNPTSPPTGTPPSPQIPTANLQKYPNLYTNLVQLPTVDQGPITLLLQMAYNYYIQNYPNTNALDYYEYLLPYLSGIINVLEYNGELSSANANQAVNLPVSDALNQIFSGLLGSTDSVDPAASINSIMQSVYNLGSDPAAPGLVSKQFSLIQQTQAAGISMIMVCVTSLEHIYTHYQNQFQAFESQLQTYVNWGSGAGIASGVLTALGSFGGVFGVGAQMAGQAANAGAEYVNLIMMQYTITEMTNISMTLMWLPIVLFVLTSLFTAGAQFALLVPLTPYILFWAGQIAWLLGVLEALVAAPIVMLGLAHPGGHQFMGHSVPAVRMLLSVVFRPVLMVIGMLTGILLTYVVISFSAQGFHTVATSILAAVPQGDQMVQGILACLMLFVYCSFIVLAFNKCFSTIYVIPDKVMEWVGGGRGDQAGAQDLQQISQGVQQSAGQAADAGGKGTQSGIDTQKSKADQTSSFDQKEVSTVSSTSQGMGKAAGGAVDSGRKGSSQSDRSFKDDTQL